MAEQAETLDPGAPVAKGTIDPELIKLGRTRAKIGVITAAGLVFLCGYFLFKLGPDRRFGGSDAQPTRVTVSEVLAGNVAADRFVQIAADPLMSNAIRTTTAKGSLGFRVMPTRATGERLWIVVSGDGWQAPSQGGYVGRLRRMSDLPFAGAIESYAQDHPRPVFAAASAVRAGFATGKVTTVSGDQVAVGDKDRVAFDLVDPNAAVIVTAFSDRQPNATAWTTALASAGIATTGTPQVAAEQARFDVSGPDAVATTTRALEVGKLWAARVESVTRHYETTWGALRGSAPTGFVVGDTTIPDAQLDLVGVYVSRGIPGDAFALLTSERPDDYWYVLPVTLALAAIGLVFAWALARAVKRDLLPTATPR